MDFLKTLKTNQQRLRRWFEMKMKTRFEKPAAWDRVEHRRGTTKQILCIKFNDLIFQVPLFEPQKASKRHYINSYGNMFPLKRNTLRILKNMNRRLTDHHIRSTCRDLLATHGPAFSGRTLRRTLKTRYGAVGKTERVMRIWRELVQTASGNSGPPLPTDVTELQRRLIAAEEGAAQANARAALAQLREQSHQDKWAIEIDRLRQQLGTQPATVSQIRMLETQVQRLSLDLMSARAMIARYEEANELLRS